MSTGAVRVRFEAIASDGDVDPIDLGARAKRGGVDALRDLAAVFARVAFIEPAHIRAAYDAAAAGWFATEAARPELRSGAAAAPQALWDDFWAFGADGARLDAAGFTMRTAALGARLDPGFKERAGRASLTYPGVAEAVAQGWPEKFRLEDLARCPVGSLGADFHRLIVDNGFDLEVLDRDALGLAALPQPLDYLNARILQCHDLWHITAGYETTPLHEVGVSAFQLGQFGHSYSAMFLAVVTTRAALTHAERARLLLDVILSAWSHGRTTPPLLGVDWPSVWDFPVWEVRDRLGVRPYESPVPADLFEQTTPSPA